MRERLLVHAIAGQGVVDVDQCHDLRRYGNLLALQPIGVSAAVVALVMPAADVARSAHQGAVAVLHHALQHIGADGGVGLHDLELLGRQLARLVQDTVGDGQFPQVMQRGCGGNSAAIA